MKRLAIAALVLVSSALPVAPVAADTGPGFSAGCTLIENIYRRNGVSFYGAPSSCEIIAAYPERFPGFTALPLDPGPLNMSMVCGWWMTDEQTEFALAWSVPGYEEFAVQYCYDTRRNGVNITFIDPLRS